MVDTVMRFMEVKVCGLLALLRCKPPHGEAFSMGHCGRGGEEGRVGGKK